MIISKFTGASSVFLLALSVLTGCGVAQTATGSQSTTAATGSVGPQGAAGPQGLPGVQGPQGIPGQQGIAGLQGPTGATGSQGPTGAVAVSFLQGKGLGVTGDSISALFNNAWQNVVVKRTGMSLVTQDARPGRRFDTTFECWGNPQAGGALGAFTAGYSFPGIGGTCGDYQTGLTDGMSFTDSLANTDLQIIEMGTNDQAVPLGQLGDATNAGTFYGNMRWVVETYLTAKPALRIVLVTVQYNGFTSPETTKQYAHATEAYGESVGVPVVNMFKLGGVNAITSPTLTRDGIHPSDFAFSNFYGPVIAQAVQKVF